MTHKAYLEVNGRRVALHRIRDPRETIKITIETNREILHDPQFEGYAVPFSKEELKYAEKHTRKLRQTPSHPQTPP